MVLGLGGWVGSAVSGAELASPSGHIMVTFEVGQDDGRISYDLAYRGRKVLSDSRLDLTLGDGTSFDRGLRVLKQQRRTHDETWKTVWGERAAVRDHYNQLSVDLGDRKASGRRLRLVFRAYDSGVAFRYELPAGPNSADVRIGRERTEFRFLEDATAWAVYHAQGRYEEVKLSQIRPGCERPLVLRLSDGTFVALGEARLVDYARGKLSPQPDRELTLVTDLHGEVEATLPLRTPWRVVMVADSPGELLENNALFLNLNDPCAIDDTSWIRPGKVIREVTLTTAGGKACVDFAAEHGLQFVEFDAGWYGHEYDEASDATTISVDPKRSPGPLDLHEVIRYAAERDIGILVYVNRRALERQLDEILPLYQRWGIKGVKYGFVRVGSQQWTSWLHAAVRKAAEHRLMVDIHDEYRPTGYSRTYPNLMTQEGIAGDETDPPARQTLTILFTRMLAGPGDNTICYYDRRVDRTVSHAFQLAKAVCIYSPWQFLYWYDRPGRAPRAKGGAGGGANVIGDEPELEFFDRLPTTWDESRVVAGEVGRYAVVARRSGREWFVGCMNGEQARELEIPLDFLDAGVEYRAKSYIDDPDVPTRTQVRIDRLKVREGGVVRTTLPANHGQALWICPAAAGEKRPVN
jgi:alpha-glucosidase